MNIEFCKRLLAKPSLLIKLFLLIYLIFYFSTAKAAANNNHIINPQYKTIQQWSSMLYYGNTAQETFGQILSGNFHSAQENIYSVELAYMLGEDNWFKKIFRLLLIDTVEIAGNYTLREYFHLEKNDLVNEGNLYFIWRWSKFPWNKYLDTTLAIGDGISYVSHVPYVDKITAKPGEDFQRLLNYMMVEATFASPALSDWQLVLRMHHRCTMSGVYGNNNAGSTAVGLGIRYKFKLF